MPIGLVRVIPSSESLNCTSHGRSRPFRNGRLAMHGLLWQCGSEVIDPSRIVLKRCGRNEAGWYLKYTYNVSLSHTIIIVKVTFSFAMPRMWYIVDTRAKMTSSNGNIFRITSSSWKGVHRSSMNSTHKGRRRGALMFSLICSWRNGWTNYQEAGDLRRHRAHSWRHCNARWTWTEEFRFKW